MRATRAVAWAVGVCGLACAPAMAQLRIAQWNITNWNGSVHTRDAAFKTAIYGISPVNGLSMSPDVLIVEEITQGASNPGQGNVNAFLSLLNTAANSPGDWAAAPYVTNQGDTGNALFYRSSRATFVAGSTVTLGTASGANPDVGSGDTQSPRDNQRWTVRVLGYSGAGATLYLYGSHMKAGGTTLDQQRREPEGLRIRNDANNLPAGSNFILGGDFNVQSSGQTFYRSLIEYNAGYPGSDVRSHQSGQFFDPINSGGTISSPVTWENVGTYRTIHTQEPSTQMDSRHDQLLVSASLRDGQGMSYLPAVAGGNILQPFRTYNSSITDGSQWADNNHSYRCWGNDAESFQNPIRTTTNTQVGSAIAQALITSVNGNGHLGVYLDLQVPAKLGAPSPPNGTVDLGVINQGASASYVLSVTNAADVARFSRDGTGWGIDGLSYSLAITPPPPTGAFSIQGGLGPFERAATPAPAAANSHTIVLDTSTIGAKSSTLTITSDDPDNPLRQLTFQATVVASGTSGACCDAMGGCTISVVSNCGGTFSGMGTSCSPNTCAQPGACCASNGGCSFVLQSVCASGNTWNGANTCSPNLCPQPAVCCNTGSGLCSIILQSACAGAGMSWLGTAVCSPNPCPQPGACCDTATGACFLVIQASCGAGNTWNGSSVCTAHLCPQPTGACCLGTGCSINTSDGCVGRFMGVGTACGPSGNPTTCCAANFDQVNGITVNDIFAFLSAWFAGNFEADINTDGTLSVPDIFTFLNKWFQGC